MIKLFFSSTKPMLSNKSQELEAMQPISQIYDRLSTTIMRTPIKTNQYLKRKKLAPLEFSVVLHP